MENRSGQRTEETLKDKKLVKMLFMPTLYFLFLCSDITHSTGETAETLAH